MYEIPTLFGGRTCFMRAWKNIILLRSLHILSVPMIMHVNPLLPARRVRMLPFSPRERPLRLSQHLGERRTELGPCTRNLTSAFAEHWPLPRSAIATPPRPKLF